MMMMMTTVARSGGSDPPAKVRVVSEEFFGNQFSQFVVILVRGGATVLKVGDNFASGASQKFF